ncbi:notchless, partial [Cystoisospora suis]
MAGDTVVDVPPSEPDGGESSSSPPGKRQKLSSSSSPSLRPLSSSPSSLKTFPPLPRASAVKSSSSSSSLHPTEKADSNKTAARELPSSWSNLSEREGEGDATDVKNREIIIQFFDQQTTPLGTHLAVPLSITREQLEELLNTLLAEESKDEEDEDDEKGVKKVFALTLDDNRIEITSSLQEAFELSSDRSTEKVLQIRYAPLAAFKVRHITRCASSLQGHTEAVLCVAFNPESSRLASGSGDMTVRLWCLSTETPQRTLKGHTGWVLCLAWAPHGQILASAGMDGTVRLWDGETGDSLGSPLKGHSKPVTALAWQPLHLSSSLSSSVTETKAGNTTITDGRLSVPSLMLASASKDSTVRLWNTSTSQCLRILSGHRDSISSLRWSGESEGHIYTASRDTTVKVWNPISGRLVADLKGHAHWVNSLALNTDHVLRTGPYGEKGQRSFASFEEMRAAAKKRYDACIKQ